MLLTPHVLHRLVQKRLLFYFVIIFGFGERTRPVFKSFWIEGLSGVIGFGFDSESGGEFLSDFFSVLLFDFFEEGRDVDIFVPLFFILFALKAFDFDEISHEVRF